MSCGQPKEGLGGQSTHPTVGKAPLPPMPRGNQIGPCECPGVVAWFTAYKMELFYSDVLCYEDGEGIFEWDSRGIMHLHSIN